MYHLDFNNLCGIAVSRLHITAQEFYNLTPIEFDYALQDFEELHRESLLQPIKAIYDSARMQAFYMYKLTPNLKKYPKSPKELWKLSWDEEDAPEEVQSIEDMKRVLYQIAGKEYKS